MIGTTEFNDIKSKCMSSPTAYTYLIIIGMLLVKLFFMSIQMSLLENKVVNLAQEMALKEKEDRDKIEDESK